MSSFGLQKSFEKTLRSSSSYQVPLTSSSKTEVHKGCTGKAHACGSVKSANTLLSNKSSSTTPKLKVKSDGKSLRKNSLSSETVSDSGSEISSSWNSNKHSCTSNPTASKPQPNPLKRTKSVNYGSSSGSEGVRRRTSESVISVNVTDNVQNGIRRGRLLSDSCDEKKVDDLSKLRRTSSFRLRNVPPMVPPKPKVPQPSATTLKRNGSLNNRLRNSFRNKTQVAAWNVLWESSFASKLGGGNLLNIEPEVKHKSSKVNYSKVLVTFVTSLGDC